MKSVLSPKMIIKSNSNDIRAIISLHFLLDQGSNQNDLLKCKRNESSLSSLRGFLFLHEVL